MSTGIGIGIDIDISVIVDGTEFSPSVMFLKEECKALGFRLVEVEFCYGTIKSWNIICKEIIGVLLLQYH